CKRARWSGRTRKKSARPASGDIPLRRCAPSPFSRTAAQFGKGDAASAAGRPLRGGRWSEPRQFRRMSALRPVSFAQSMNSSAHKEHTMQRRTTLHTALAVIAATTLAWGTGTGAQAQQPGAAPRIAVTDLAYAQRVSEYFMAGTYQRSSQMSAGGSHS